jgi:hypothetical protein
MITDLLPTFLPRRPKWKLGKIGLCWMREMALQRLGKHQHKENRLCQKGAEAKEDHKDSGIFQVLQTHMG